MSIQLCLFGSTGDMTTVPFVVQVLTGMPAELAQRALEWGYDGIEFLPNPVSIPDPHEFAAALVTAGAVMPVVNTGRMFAQGLTLLNADRTARQRALAALKRILEFAGHFKARVGLGAARGAGMPGASPKQMSALAEDVFRELAAYAEKVHAVIMLEPADPGVTSLINTVDEASAWVDRIHSPAFSLMLDTYQLSEAEASIEHGIRAAHGQARHIHLYDPGRWPPGILPEEERLDWPKIARLLWEEGFSGSGSVVLAPEGDPEPAARQAVAFLRRVFAEGEQP